MVQEDESFMRQSIARPALLISLGANVIAMAGAARTIYARGGWEYVRAALEGAPHAGINLDVANYTHRQTLFERLPRPGGRIVFAGDSLTQGCEWGEWYSGALNRGIGGDTSAGFLKRVHSITELRPRAVFLMIGSNDLFNLGLGPEQTLANIRGIVTEIRHASPQTAIYLQSNLPTWSVRQNVHTRAVNRGLRTMADGKTAFYVDLYPAFLRNDVLNPEFTSDGGHLNGNGYEVWKRLIGPYMQALIPGPAL